MLRALLFCLANEYLFVCCLVFNVGDQTQGHIHIEQMFDC